MLDRTHEFKTLTCEYGYRTIAVDKKQSAFNQTIEKVPKILLTFTTQVEKYQSLYMMNGRVLGNTNWDEGSSNAFEKVLENCIQGIMEVCTELQLKAGEYTSKDGRLYEKCCMEMVQGILQDSVAQYNRIQNKRNKNLASMRPSLLPEHEALNQDRTKVLQLELEHEEDLELTEEEKVQFKAENEQLEQRLHEELDEARTMETKITEISSLMDTFSRNVSQQHEQLEDIYEAAKSSKGNVDKGNEQLGKAKEHGSNFGFHVFCVLVFISILLHMFNYFMD